VQLQQFDYPQRSSTVAQRKLLLLPLLLMMVVVRWRCQEQLLSRRQHTWTEKGGRCIAPELCCKLPPHLHRRKQLRRLFASFRA
jgi:hypothetical protein